jgi:uncharacterized protein YvpB
MMALAAEAAPKTREAMPAKPHHFRAGPGARALLVALIAALVGAIPLEVAASPALGREVQRAAQHVKQELVVAISEGLPGNVGTDLQHQYDQLAQTVGNPNASVATRRQQLAALVNLEQRLHQAYAASVADERNAFLRNVRRLEDAEANAQQAGFFFDDIASAANRVVTAQSTARTPADFRGLATALAAQTDSLLARLAAFSQEQGKTEAALAQANAALADAGRYPELGLSAFRDRIAAVETSMQAVHLPEGFKPLQDQAGSITADIQLLLAARTNAYGELNAARAALVEVRAQGVDVSGPTARVDRLAGQLSHAADTAAFDRIAAALRSETAAIRGLLVRLIPVPVYQQAMPLDCETSALRMALAYFGFRFSDAELFAHETPDLRPPVMGPNHTIVSWGDPYTNFVGDVWGNDSTPTGYGVYYPVILEIARSHGIAGAVGGEGYAASTIYKELYAGHPVEVWVEVGWQNTFVGTWTAWDGRAVRYSFREHAVLLTGVSSTSVRVNDPWHGTQEWISKDAFERSWADFNNMAVIFR